jgi:GxxExxY protein
MTDQSQPGLPHADVTERILGAFFDVHRELGYGFSEVVYRRAISIVLRSSGLNAIEEMLISVPFRGVIIGNYYPDIIVAGVVLVEVKATAVMENYAQAQILNYLKAAGGGVGLLLNFGREPTFKRFAMGNPTNSLPALRPPE